MMNFMKAVSEKLKQTASEVKKEMTGAPAQAGESSSVQARHQEQSFVRDLKAFIPQERTPIEAQEDVPQERRALMKVLQSQDALLDSILTEQEKMHRNVKSRDWDALQRSISEIRVLSDSFVALDRQRETLAGEDRKIYFEPGVEPLFTRVRTKLTKSKIENDALSAYVSATKDFIGGIIEECYTNNGVCYGQNGRMVSTEVDSVLINTEF